MEQGRTQSSHEVGPGNVFWFSHLLYDAKGLSSNAQLGFELFADGCAGEAFGLGRQISLDFGDPFCMSGNGPFERASRVTLPPGPPGLPRPRELKLINEFPALLPLSPLG